METIIVEIAKYTYINKLFLWLGLSEELSGLFALIITSGIIYLLIHWANSFYNKCKTRKAAKDLAPYYDERDVKRATKYFISTNGQNISPTKEEEPAFGNKFITREELIPFFIDNVFQGKKESDKFYLILADSGMGKTTFLINLYMKYNSISRIFKSKYDMKMLPLGDDRIIQRIKDIANNQDKAKKTILLLDAFDEYKGLIPPKISDGLTDDERFRKLLDEIFEITRDFRNVIITSRTQYFPAQEENPYELNIRCFGKDEFHKLSKLYLSPFDEKDIKKYLNKKFGVLKFWNYKKKRKAKKITGDSHKLMVRPMLLSYIDLLVDEDNDYKHTFDIYDTLVKKWIEREGNKRKHNNEDREKFKNDLLKFSKLVAIEIYESGEYSKGIDKNTAEDIRKKHNLDLEGYEITGQSLLVRNADEKWKFAHKSIYEFFIAEKAIYDLCFGFNLDMTSLDMTKKFIGEKENDKSPSLFLNYILINEEDNYYISRIDYGDFSKLSAISYCNQLNETLGYKIHYDETGKLLDENNNKIIEPTKIKGFIFPTIKEYGLAIKNDINCFGIFYFKNYIIHHFVCDDDIIVTSLRLEHSKKYKNYFETSKNNFHKIKDIHTILPEWTIELLREDYIEFDFINDDSLIINKEKLCIYTDSIRKKLRLIFVNNLT